MSDDRFQLCRAEFEIKLNLGWTRTTTKVNAHFESLAWCPIQSDWFGEIVLSHWKDRKQTPFEYFYGLLDRAIINEVINIKKLYGNLYLISFTGPVRDTVRKAIISRKVAYYTSSIKEGLQKWKISCLVGQLKSVISGLSTIGKIVTIYQQYIGNEQGNSPNNYFLDNFCLSNMISELILTKKEYEIVKSAIDLNYFDEGSRVRIEEIAKNQLKNKSTVDRELKNAINKLIKVLFWEKNF